MLPIETLPRKTSHPGSTLSRHVGSLFPVWVVCFAVVSMGCTEGGKVASETIDVVEASGAGKDEVQEANGKAPEANSKRESLWTRSQGEDWPSFLGPRGNGTSTETGIRKQWSDGSLPILWQRRLGTSYGIGAVSRGRYFQFDRHGDMERLSCWNAETGEELWQWETPVRYQDMYGYNDGPRCSPVVDADRVYVYGVTGTLACLQTQTGQLLWKKDTESEFNVVQNFFGVGSTPLIYGDALWVMVGGSAAGSSNQTGSLTSAAGNGSGVVAFHKLTGEVLFKFSDELASYSSPIAMSTPQGDRLLFLMRGGLLGVDPVQGKQSYFFPWRSETFESVNAAVPVVRDTQVLVSETYSVGSALLELKSGEPVLLRKDPAVQREQSFRAHWATPVVVGDYLYGCSGRNQPDADFRCVRWSDGQVMWKERTHDRSSVLSVDGHLIVLGEEGKLQLILPSPEKLQVVAELDLGLMVNSADQEPWLSPPCWAAPILSHGLLYVRGRDRLICFELIPQ